MVRLVLKEIRAAALGVLCAAIGVAGTVVASADAATPGCVAITNSHAFYSVTVNNGRVSCGTARYVLSDVLAGRGVKHGGPYAYEEWLTFDGWRCGFGAGGASCVRARAGISTNWVADECGINLGRHPAYALRLQPSCGRP